MQNIIIYSRHPKDEPVLQHIENYLQHLSHDVKAAIATAALYKATQPPAIGFNYICIHSCNCKSSIALLRKLSPTGLLAVDRVIAEELAVLEQLQGAIG